MTTTLQVGDLKSAALALAGRGLKVFPLTVRGKEPLGGNGHLDATSDPAAIERMWQGATFANIGVAATASGLYIVDVDMDPVKGKQGGRTWAAYVAEHGHVDTYTVRSWSGGLHFWYRMPEGMSLRNTSGRSGGRGIGLDVDTRGNGYVVAPPSMVSENGRTGSYEVEHDLPIMDLPVPIINMCRDVERPERPAGHVPSADEDLVVARVRSLARQLEAAPDGEGNHTASRVAFWAGQYVGAGQISQDLATRLLLDAIAGWSWRTGADERSMHATIIRGVDEGTKQPRAWERPVAISVPEVTPLVLADAEPDPEPEKPAEEASEEEKKEADRDLSDWATDLGQAHHLAERLKPPMMHADGVGWHVWDGTRWKPVTKDHIANMATRFYRKQFRYALDRYKASEDERFLVLAKAYKSFMGTSRLANIVKMLSVIDGVFADPATLDAHPTLLNTPTGVVDLKNGSLAPHDPTLLFTKVTAGRYRPGYRHADWVKALTALPPEQADYMQIRMGHATTGHNAKDVLFMVGTGANGKSAYATEGVFPALGDYAHMAQPTLISKGQGTGATPDRASLRGVRFALIEELPESHALSVEEIKRIADTAIITARMLHANPITYTASHSLFVTSNSKPSVSEVDHGTWRRLLLVDFPYTFVEKPETEMERVGDPTLKRRIREGGQGQHDAIVTWLVEGAMRYFADPMLMEIERRPLAVREAIQGWQMEADRIMAYFTDRLVVDPDGIIARSDLYADFTNFLAGQGHSRWSQETLLSRFRIHEMVRKAMLTEGQTRNHESLSRPLAAGVKYDSTIPSLPKVVRVFRGIKFRKE